MSLKNQTGKKFELCQSDIIFTKISKIYIFISVQRSKKIFNYFTCNKPMKISFNATSE